MATEISKLATVLTVNSAGFSAGMGAAGRDVDKLKSSVDGASPSIASMGAGLGKAGAVGAALAIGAALAAAGGKGVALAAEYEQVTVAMTTMFRSAEVAKTVLGDLTRFAAETPFEFPELAGAAKKLVAFGEGSDTVVSSLRTIGDISAGIGAPIGEIAELYGKARVQGRLFQEDINQFQGRGINVTKELAKQFGVTAGEVKKLVETGQVSFANLQNAFVNMTGAGGQYEGMMKVQAGTLGGLWSTLTDNVNNKLRTTAEAAIKTFGVKSLLEGLVSLTSGPAAPEMSAAQKAAEQAKAARAAAAAVEAARQGRITLAIGAETTKLQEQIATYGMSAAAVDRYKLAHQGATQAQLASFDAAAAQVDALNRQKKAAEDAAAAQAKMYADMTTAAKSYIESSMDPLDKLNQQLMEINKLEKAGFLFAEQAAAASTKLAADFTSGMKWKQQRPDDPTFGRGSAFGTNTAALERRFTAGFTADVAEGGAANARKIAEDSLKEQRKISKNTDPKNRPKTVRIG